MNKFHPTLAKSLQNFGIFWRVYFEPSFEKSLILGKLLFLVTSIIQSHISCVNNSRADYDLSIILD